MEGIDVFVGILKIAGIVVAAIVAIFGLIIQYRDSGSRTISRWGRSCLVLIATAAVIALMTHGLEVFKAQALAEQAAKEAEEATVRAQTLLDEVQTVAADAQKIMEETKLHSQALDRILYPIEDVRISFEISCDDRMSDALMQKYRARLIAGVDTLIKANGERFFERDGVSLISTLPNGERRFSVTQASSLFPHETEEEAPSNLLSGGVLQIAFFRPPLDFKKNSIFDDNIFGMGLVKLQPIVVCASGAFSRNPLSKESTLELLVGKPSGSVTLAVDSAPAGVDDFNRRTGLVDILGSQMVAWYESNCLPLTALDDGRQVPTLQGLKVRSLHIEIGKSHFVFERDWRHFHRLTEHKDGQGRLYYTFNVPETKEEFLKVTTD